MHLCKLYTKVEYKNIPSQFRSRVNKKVRHLMSAETLYFSVTKLFVAINLFATKTICTL